MLNQSIDEYTKQLSQGKIQRAYRGIMTFMSGLKKHMEEMHPEYCSGALYSGYMDMTYFAFTPVDLKTRNLKIAVVYLHEQNRFEVWLGGGNRKAQAACIAKMQNMNIGDYKLSRVAPGIDSIIECQIVDHPDFDQPEELTSLIELKTIKFINDVLLLLV